MKFKKRLSATIFLFIFSFSLLSPSTAYARISFRKFFRALRRGTRFVVNLPNKATRFLGPTLGPIAADLISINLGKNPKFGAFFNKARRLDKIAGNIEEQNKLMNELKQIYSDQATDLRQKADDIRQIRKDLASELVKGNITREEHLERVADLQAIAQAYDDTADKLDRSSDRLNPAQIIKILGSDFIKNSIVKIRNLIKSEISDEFNRFLDPNVIKNIISNGDSFEGLMQILLSDELSQLKDDKDFDFDKFKDELMDKIRQMLEEDKDALKDNWQQKMQDLIRQQIKDSKLPSAPTPTPRNETIDDLYNLDSNGNQPTTDEHGCKPGYIWKRNTGTGCVQEDCLKGSVPNAHISYDGYCVCGSSGSIHENPDDPNIECHYDNSYVSCPGCVFTCVHKGEECPEMP